MPTATSTPAQTTAVAFLKYSLHTPPLLAQPPESFIENANLVMPPMPSSPLEAPHSLRKMYTPPGCLAKHQPRTQTLRHLTVNLLPPIFHLWPHPPSFCSSSQGLWFCPRILHMLFPLARMLSRPLLPFSPSSYSPHPSQAGSPALYAPTTSYSCFQV